MPLPPCFFLADDVFPKVRAEAARRLTAQGWSQVRVAQAIGISQGMVSKHVAMPPSSVDPLVARLTTELIQGLNAQPRSQSPWCATLTVAEGRAGGDAALEDLLAAEAMLRAGMPLRFMPQIGLNIARALPDAKTPDDVLSYAGRLVDAGGVLVAPAPPSFGASGHLARCLIHLRSRDPRFKALANVKGGAETARAWRHLGWSVAEIAADRQGDPEAPFRRAVDVQRAAPAYIHDGKAAGIEPCLYVAGTDAIQVARQVLALCAAGPGSAV